MFIFLLLLLLLSLIIEGTVTTMPLVLVSLILLTLLRRASVFPIAFFAGLILDVFAVRPLGSTSLFFLLLLFLVLLYQRKYEIFSFPFVAIASFIGTFFFLVIFGYPHVFLQATLSMLIASCIFVIMRFFSPENSSGPVTPARAGIHLRD